MKRRKKPSSHSWCCFNYSPVPVCANKFEWDLWLRDLFSERKMQLLPVALTHISCLAPSHLNIWLQDPDTESSVCVGLPSVQITESPRKITVIIETKPATYYPSSSQQLLTPQSQVCLGWSLSLKWSNPRPVHCPAHCPGCGHSEC